MPFVEMPAKRMTQTDLRAVLESDVLAAAPALLGCELVRSGLRARIVEVEAYRQDEPACHAFGKSKMKNMALYSDPGRAYVYFSYGTHWMLNIVAHPPGNASALLIRAAKPIAGQEEMFARRPKARGEEDLLSLARQLIGRDAFNFLGRKRRRYLLDHPTEFRG